ncbi:hypothetical protein PM082_023856 [Marasmius tenuissimus]|nr:hypothetical protein PM082_023856 [Marasmius tenuissimus]
MSLQSHVRSRYPNRVIRICIYVWAFTVTNPSPLAMNREYDLAFNGGLGRQMCLPVPLLHSTDGMVSTWKVTSDPLAGGSSGGIDHLLHPPPLDHFHHPLTSTTKSLTSTTLSLDRSNPPRLADFRQR